MITTFKDRGDQTGIKPVTSPALTRVDANPVGAPNRDGPGSSGNSWTDGVDVKEPLNLPLLSLLGVRHRSAEVIIPRGTGRNVLIGPWRAGDKEILSPVGAVAYGQPVGWPEVADRLVDAGVVRVDRVSG